MEIRLNKLEKYIRFCIFSAIADAEEFYKEKFDAFYKWELGELSGNEIKEKLTEFAKLGALSGIEGTDTWVNLSEIINLGKKRNLFGKEDIFSKNSEWAAIRKEFKKAKLRIKRSYAKKFDENILNNSGSTIRLKRGRKKSEKTNPETTKESIDNIEDLFEETKDYPSEEFNTETENYFDDENSNSKEDYSEDDGFSDKKYLSIIEKRVSDFVISTSSSGRWVIWVDSNKNTDSGFFLSIFNNECKIYSDIIVNGIKLILKDYSKKVIFSQKENAGNNFLEFLFNLD